MTAAVTEVDVCIVGFGPTGVTLANLLGLQGIRTLVVERQPAAYDLPRAIAFDAEIMRTFQAIGLADRILPTTQVPTGVLFLDTFGRTLLELPRPQGIGREGWHSAYRFHQPELEAILREGIARFGSVSVRDGCEFLGAGQDKDGVTVRLQDLRTQAIEKVRCRFLVGADGARSRVRDQLIGTDWHDLKFSQDWLVVDVELKRPKPELGDGTTQYCEPGRPSTYVRGTRDYRRWEIALLQDEDPAEQVRPDQVWARLARWLRPDEAELLRAASYTFRSVVNRRWRDGRIFIAGDAAHLTPPFLGQGMCAGIRDTANLAWKLARALSGPQDQALLDSYASERIPHVTQYIDNAVRLGEVINSAALDNIEQGEATRSGGLRVQMPAPRLGPGLAAGWTQWTGQIAPQPVLGDGRRADDTAGYRFTLYARPGLGIRAHDRLAVIDDDAVQPWLDELGAEAAMLRPDRYLLGAARNRTELDELLLAV